MKLLKDFIQYKSEFKSLKKETLDLYFMDIKDFEEFLKKDLLEVIKTDILKYIEFLKESYQPNSILRKISTIKTFYRYLQERKLVDDNPTDGIIIEKASEKEL
ncbi:MAG: site-specific integrase, partial [Cetobacterium sp.]